MFAILKQLALAETDIVGEGVVEVLSDGFGFLRSPDANYLPGPETSVPTTQDRGQRSRRRKSLRRDRGGSLRATLLRSGGADIHLKQLES